MATIAPQSPSEAASPRLDVADERDLRLDEEAEIAAGERELARRFARFRDNEAALLAILRRGIPMWQRLTARVVLHRTLGSAQAHALLARAWGASEAALPVAGSGAGVVRGGGPSSSDGAGSVAHEAEAERAADEVTARLSSGSPASNMPRVIPLGGPLDEVLGDSRGGQPLSEGLRARLEGAFGWRFGAVRLHRDAAAASRLAQAGAAALTSGTDIYFDPQLGDPESEVNRRALAHELAHVVQQQRSVGLSPSLSLGASRGRGAAARLTSAPITAAQALPKVTDVKVDAEVGLGKSIDAKAILAAGTPPGTQLKWTSSMAGITLAPLDATRVRATLPAAALKGKGGVSFKLTAALKKTPGDSKDSAPIMIVEVQKATYTAVPPFGGPYAYPGGFPTSVAPKDAGDPNRDGVVGNSVTVTPVTAPVGRATTIKLTTPLGATAAGLVVTPGSKTGKIGLRIDEDKTHTALDDKLLIDAVPTRVSGFGAQTAAPAGAGWYGVWNTVNFAMSHGAMNTRPVAEMITAGPRNDFGIIPNGGWHVAPTLPFSAPTNSWTDQNSTGNTHPKIDVNLYEGPGVPSLPRIMIFKQTFHWMAWSGTQWSKAIDSGIHRRSLIKKGTKYFFRTEQIFPGGSAPVKDDKYVGPALITLSNVKAVPLLPAPPAATAIAADGKATGAVTVKTTVPGKNVKWTITGGGSVAFTAGAVGPVGGPTTVTATLVPGVTKVKVTDATYPNRFAEGTIKTVPVKLTSMTAPTIVGAGKLVANLSVTANPGGRNVDFKLDAAAIAGGVTVAPGVPGAGAKVTTTITRPAAFKGKVTVTASDHVLPAATATKEIRFQ